MKILHIITRLDPGGSSRICRTMVKELRKNGLDVILAAGGSVTADEDVINLQHLVYFSPNRP